MPKGKRTKTKAQQDAEYSKTISNLIMGLNQKPSDNPRINEMKAKLKKKSEPKKVEPKKPQPKKTKKDDFRAVILPDNKLVSKLNKNELLNLDKMGDCKGMNANQVKKEITQRKRKYNIPKGLSVCEYNLYANKH